MSEEPQNTVPRAAANLVASPAELYATAFSFAYLTLAPDWFADALIEARKPPSLDSKRREIIFSACCIESYLLEWTRDTIVKVRPPDNMPMDKWLEEFFPNNRVGVDKRWRDVIDKLITKGLIHERPEFGSKRQGHDEGWQLLLDYRNDLVHANVSRPFEPSMRTSPQRLHALGSGWAVRVVIERIRLLHKAAKTDAPEWLIDPS